jgi:hypothetical protein
MRWLLALLLTMGLSLVGGYILLKGYPYRLYSRWLQGQEWNKYYTIEKFRPLLLKSEALEKIESYNEDYVQLWKVFPIRNSLIPLPTRHPLFLTVPIIERKDKHSELHLGMTILSSTGREISRIYTLPTNHYRDYTIGQELFKLPFVRNRILKHNQQQVWRDVFSREIKVESKSLDEMIYDLYILHVRSELLPEETVRYGLIKDGKQVMIELLSRDKDYSVELVLTQDNGTIYSYVIVTEKRNEESQKLRTKFLSSVNFSPIDDAMANLIYKEFKHLNFSRQVDQEGMLYLFSAWSQNLQKVDYFKEMIFYLERGVRNTASLRVLYEFSFKHYGKTFTTRNTFDPHEDPEMALQRKIEIEEMQTRKKAEQSELKAAVAPALTPDEKMDMYLKKVKEEKARKKDDMTIH